LFKKIQKLYSESYKLNNEQLALYTL
jgi:hypothetical protein